jgi:hypothetical protein
MTRLHCVIYLVLASWATLACAYDDEPVAAPLTDDSKFPDSNRTCEDGISPRFAALDYWYISNCTTLANQPVLFFILVVR